MAKVYTKYLFSWKDLDDLGDLERLQLILESLPDEELIKTLSTERGNGRNVYSIRAMWNSFIAGIVYRAIPDVNFPERNLED